MIARIRPTPQGCSEQSFRELTFAMNARPQRIVIRQDALAECLACHAKQDGQKPDLSPTYQGRKYVVVDRLALFAFVNDHGSICPGGK